MGSVGANRSGGGVNNTEVNPNNPNMVFRDNTNGVDVRTVMENAYFKNAATLVATISKADNGRFDIVNRTNNGDSGSVAYMDMESSDGVTYEVKWQRDYSDPERKRIMITSYREYEEGEY